MKKSDFILLMLSVFWGCETGEPVSPTPPKPDTSVVDTIQVEIDTSFHYETDSTKLRHLLLGTWVKFEVSAGGGFQPSAPQVSETYRPEGVLEFRDFQTDSLICQGQYQLRFRANRFYTVYPYDRAFDTLWLPSGKVGMPCATRLDNWSLRFENDTVFTIAIPVDTIVRYRKLKK